MTRATAFATALGAIVFTMFLRDGRAAADCAAPPVPVPGLSGPPVWLPPTPGSTAWRAQLEDPRWAAGPVHAFTVLNAGASQQQALYRFVQSGGSLYVSIQVLVDPDGTDGVDSVYFGITNGSGNVGANLFQLPLDTGDPPSPCPGPAPGLYGPCPIPTSSGLITWYSTPNRGAAPPVWTPQASPPAWLKNVATWPGGTPNVAWAVTFQIDTSAVSGSGSPITGATNVFFGAGIQASPGTIVYLTSSSQPSVTNPAIGPGIPAGAVITDWVPLDALGAACPPGISISASSVGIPSGGSLTNQVDTCPIPPNPPGTTCTNTFRTEASGVPGGAAAWSLRTRIRVADWGSTIADPSAPWIDFGIHQDVFVNPAASFTAATGWAWSQSGSTVDIDYTCKLDAGARYCPQLPGSTQQHQCMLFEIAPSPDAMGAPGFNIQPPAAVYRNMDFGTLSSLHEPAKITLKGLEKALGVKADRDVYVYVDIHNMPAHDRTPRELPQKALLAARAYAVHPPPLPKYDREANRPPPGPTPSTLELPLLTADQALTEAYPTYKVFVYYDSGRTVTVKGRVEKVLVPMVPFGFYLDHVGTFYGFEHSLDFLVSGAREILPHFYVIRAANEGDVPVRTNITAAEAPAEPPVPPVHHWTCSCNVVRSTSAPPLAPGLAMLGGAVFLIRRRRRAV